MILVWDTGASYELTPFRSDFIDYVKCDLPVKYVTKANRVIGIGTTHHRLIDRNGQYIFLPCISYHLTQTDVRLFSPHNYHQMHGGNSVVKGNQVTMQLLNHRIHIPIDFVGKILQVFHHLFVDYHQNLEIGPQMCLSLS